MSKDGSHGENRKEERMTKILSQDDQKDGDAVNQEKKCKRLSSSGEKTEEVCGTGETCTLPGPDSVREAELSPRERQRLDVQIWGLRPTANDG